MVLFLIFIDNFFSLSVNSFVNLAKEVLDIDGVQFLLSERFSQDPLEEHFGRHRRRGGCNDNPSLVEYGRQEISINVMKSTMMRDIRGNTRGSDRDNAKMDINAPCSMPKRRKTR